jgi:hypothetical protein
MQFTDGQPYPCAVSGASSTMKCYYQAGSGYQPTKIQITDFTYSTTLTFAILLPNPTSAGIKLTATLLAFGGTRSAGALFGHKFMGRWYFKEMFETVTTTLTTNTGQNFSPTKGAYLDSTSWNMVIPATVSLTRTLMLRLPLYSTTFSDSNICTISSPSTTYLFNYQKGNNIEAFMVSDYSSSALSLTAGNNVAFSNIKCKHFNFNPIVYFYTGESTTSYKSTYTLQTSSFDTLLSAVTSKPVYIKSDTQTITTSVTTAWVLLELDVSAWLGVAGFSMTAGLNYQMTVVLGSRWWNSMSSVCTVSLGFSNSLGSQVGCSTTSPDTLVISNFDGFASSPVTVTAGSTTNKYLIRLQVKVNTHSTTYNAPLSISTTVNLFANPEARAATQPIFRNTFTISK